MRVAGGVSDGFAAEDELIAFRANRRESLVVAPAPARRDWMPTTPGDSARWCLPLVLANASGWELLVPRTVTAVWDGTNGTEGVEVTVDSGTTATDFTATSEFGSGIVSFVVPYLFRTAPGFDLLVRGPVNRPKDAVGPLEGLVEADWAVMTFTMNWMITRPGVEVRWEVGEPYCMLVPQRRADLEAVRPAYRQVKDVPETAALLRQALEARRGLRARTALARAAGLVRRGTDVAERVYFRGRYPDGRRAPVHRGTVRLRAFAPPDQD